MFTKHPQAKCFFSTSLNQLSELDPTAKRMSERGLRQSRLNYCTCGGSPMPSSKRPRRRHSLDAPPHAHQEEKRGERETNFSRSRPSRFSISFPAYFLPIGQHGRKREKAESDLLLLSTLMSRSSVKKSLFSLQFFLHRLKAPPQTTM